MYSYTQTYMASCAWCPIFPLFIVCVVCLSETVKVYFLCMIRVIFVRYCREETKICLRQFSLLCTSLPPCLSALWFTAKALQSCTAALWLNHEKKKAKRKEQQHKEYLLDRWNREGFIGRFRVGWCKVKMYVVLKDNLTVNFTKFALLKLWRPKCFSFQCHSSFTEIYFISRIHKVE